VSIIAPAVFGVCWAAWVVAAALIGQPRNIYSPTSAWLATLPGRPVVAVSSACSSIDGHRGETAMLLDEGPGLSGEPRLGGFVRLGTATLQLWQKSMASTWCRDIRHCFTWAGAIPPLQRFCWWPKRHLARASGQKLVGLYRRGLEIGCWGRRLGGLVGCAGAGLFRECLACPDVGSSWLLILLLALWHAFTDYPPSVHGRRRKSDHACGRSGFSWGHCGAPARN